MMARSALICFFMLMTVPMMGAQEKIDLRKDVEVYPLAPGIWRHVTYTPMEGWGLVPANGLIVQDKEHAAMIDTPWTPEQTAILLDWVEKNLKAKVEVVVVGHHHVDCLGGLPEIRKRGIRSIGLDMARELALAEKVEAPQETFTNVYELKVGERKLELFYPGPGHTADNIVTWIADQKVLFGGCLVKSAYARTLGYTKEADLTAWPATLANLRSKYPNVKIIVPGHGDPGGWELVDNTLKLIKDRNEAKDTR
jgi:metallo-beta-lactamase class B